MDEAMKVHVLDEHDQTVARIDFSHWPGWVWHCRPCAEASRYGFDSAAEALAGYETHAKRRHP